MFTHNPNLEFLVDIAHIYSYEHLPLGRGEIDFMYIFDEILCNYEGRIIFEVGLQNEDIIKSKEIIESLVTSHNKHSTKDVGSLFL